ncbi:MAG: ATP-binding cassette domain-containing protein, partial [Actinobacteria bacterium]|nr:ATP-binding cassette domain-containing protein [Actinomycetota bacterium]
MDVEVPRGPLAGEVARATHAGRAGVRIVAERLGRTLAGGVEVLADVTLAIEPGELIGIVGGSGAGKTTLLEVLAGVTRPDRGVVTYDGVDLHAHLDGFRSVLGYVPQDDIIHTELPLARTLAYAARLRLDPALGGAAVDAAVRNALDRLGLTPRADTRVAALSGGQRKRASIAAELLTRPAVFFLDEPTSGLDPVTGAELLGVLRDLADTEATVVFTTHAVEDLARCDRVVFLAPGGRLRFVGTVAAACAHFGVAGIHDVYAALALPAEPAGGPTADRDAAAASAPAPAVATRPQVRRQPGALRQWSVLTARSFETMARNRLTLAILLGSPVMIIAMFLLLFQRGAFEPADPDPTSILMILFWVTFGAFFFGLTYGLLQICTERPILRREHLVGLRLGAYLLSKVAVLVPFLVAINVLMLIVLRALDRLPAADATTYLSLGVTLTLDATAALAIGLLASAAVRNPAQATLALPMLCFPAVLFSGAILPVHV